MAVYSSRSDYIVTQCFSSSSSSSSSSSNSNSNNNNNSKNTTNNSKNNNKKNNNNNNMLIVQQGSDNFEPIVPFDTSKDKVKPGSQYIVNQAFGILVTYLNYFWIQSNNDRCMSKKYDKSWRLNFLCPK